MKFLNSRIKNDIRIFQRSFEIQAFVRRATAEYNIRLSMCEYSIAQIYTDGTSRYQDSFSTQNTRNGLHVDAVLSFAGNHISYGAACSP